MPFRIVKDIAHVRANIGRQQRERLRLREGDGAEQFIQLLPARVHGACVGIDPQEPGEGDIRRPEALIEAAPQPQQHLLAGAAQSQEQSGSV
ncbi:MAG: hypothetical protein QM757_26040 [Paludibaculum sp.]